MTSRCLFVFLSMLVHGSLLPLLVVTVEAMVVKVDVNSALGPSPDDVHEVHNSHQCYSLCVARAICVSFEYDLRERECRLFFKTTGGKLQSKKNSIIQDLPKDLPMNKDSPCNKRTCEENKICSTFPGGHLCLTLKFDCGVPVVGTGVEVAYNQTLYGSVAEFKCKPSYVINDGSNSSTCQANGRWAGSAMTCKDACTGNGYSLFGNRLLCLKVSNSREIWKFAKLACESEGARLVKIDTEAKNKAVIKLAKSHSGEKYFLGAHDPTLDGNFMWLDGSPLTYTYWIPENPSGSEYCLNLVTTTRYLGWNDAPCDRAMFYICEKMMPI